MEVERADALILLGINLKLLDPKIICKESLTNVIAIWDPAIRLKHSVDVVVPVVEVSYQHVMVLEIYFRFVP